MESSLAGKTEKIRYSETDAVDNLKEIIQAGVDSYKRGELYSWDEVKKELQDF